MLSISQITRQDKLFVKFIRVVRKFIQYVLFIELYSLEFDHIEETVHTGIPWHNYDKLLIQERSQKFY